MLLINKKQVTISGIEKALNIRIPVDKILKKPLYEINPALVVPDHHNNGAGAVKVRQGIEFPAYFRVKLKTGEDVEIRYCTNRTPDKTTHGQTEVFSPRKVSFEGKAEFIGDEEDKAVYYYLHFYNRQSPFRNKGYQYEGKPFEYEFQDNEAKADAAIAMIKLRTEATTHALNLDGENLMIIAKGMKIDGVHGMEPREVKATLMQFADSNPKLYLEKAQSQVNHIVGLIYDAIDKDIFVLENYGGIHRWRWAVGAKKDELIVELSSNVRDFKEALITHIQQTPGVVNEFLPVLLNARLAVAAQNNITNELQGVNILDMVKGAAETNAPMESVTPAANSYTQPDEFIDEEGGNDIDKGGEEEFSDEEAGLPFPTEFKHCSPYIKSIIGTGDPKLAGKLWNAIKAKEVDELNVGDFINEIKFEQDSLLEE